MSAERDRLEADRGAWLRWGPYLAERAWGTVREDYSEHGTAWDYFPHDHARSRAYRWNEDGLGGISDDHGFLCFAWAFWNGNDPILKERIFGLNGHEGNHGEDAKELWWYLDSTPTHSWMRWRYIYPQREFPYATLVDENRRAGRHVPEYELLDTGILDDDRYWDIACDYAKAGPDDICIRLTIRNAGPDESTLHVLPTLWFRNTWAWGRDDRKAWLHANEEQTARIDAGGHSHVGPMSLCGDDQPALLFCENETNYPLLFGLEGPTPYPKDGIGDHLIHGTPTVNPSQQGTKAAMHYAVTVAAGQTKQIRLRLSRDGSPIDETWATAMSHRVTDADDFYNELIPAGASSEEALIARQAFAGMLWCKQFFHFDVSMWLDGDPAQPRPPAARARGRNAQWRHLNNADVISMPDPWEYPWYAAWDLAFHCVALAHVDAEFAKEQLILLCREWYMHPNGQLPAYEWAFGDVNPPVHAWAALRVFEIDGSRDFRFLERIIHKLLLNFTWWVNRKDEDGNNIFEGGFLGLDNIGPIDRSAQLPVDGHIEQSDGTAWMAMYCLNLLEISLVLARHDDTYEDVATKFFEHFAYVATAMDEGGLWDDADGFYYDVLHIRDGRREPLKVRSMVGLIPLAATMTLSPKTIAALPDFAAHFEWFIRNKREYADKIDQTRFVDGAEARLLAIVDPERLVRVLRVVLDEDEFLSPYGLRSLSARHRQQPYSIMLGGMTASVAYEPGESTSGLFGGNSNWRGPIWFPVNYLLIEALRRFDTYFGQTLTVEHPSRSGDTRTLGDVADEISGRLISLFVSDDAGRRPVFGRFEKHHSDPAWRDCLLFHEYFHGDNGAGLGASHQTGWTGLVADMIIRRHQS